MQLVVVLVTLLVGVHGTSQKLGLDALTHNTLAVTSTAVDTSAGFNIINVVNNATYYSDGLNTFDLSFNVTYTGNLQSVFSLTAYLTFTGPGTFPVYSTGATCAQAGPAGIAITGFTNRTDLFNTVSYQGPASFVLNVVGTYTGTINLYNFGQSVATATFTFGVTAAFANPTLPALATLVIPALQANSTPQITATITGGATSQDVTVYFVGGGFQSVAWYSGDFSTTTSFDGFDKLGAYVGGFCGDAFKGVGYITLNTGTFPQDVPVTARSVTVQKTTAGVTTSASSGPLAGNTVFQSSVGSTDVLPPTCTVANFAATTVTTTNVASPIGVTVTCSGTGGAIAYQAAIIRATSGGAYVDALVDTSPGVANPQYQVPLFKTGSVEILGVVAVDATGNGVVYGSCGDYANSLSTVCGSSSSSTVVASFALMMILAVLAL